MHLQKHLRRQISDRMRHSDHRSADNIRRSALDRRVDRRALGKARGWTFGIDLWRMDDTAKQGFHTIIGFGEGNRIVHIFFDPRKPLKIAIDKPLCLAARNAQIARQPKA